METVLLGWPYVGLVLALLLLVWLALEPRPQHAPPRWRDPATVLPLLWPMYLIHQFEEHGIDLLGRHYAFLGELCQVLGATTHCPATPAFIFAVNAVGCQLTFAMSVVFRKRAPLVAACAWGVALVNGVVHLAPAALRQAYNPGAFTSLVLFAPLCGLMLWTVLRAGVVRPREVWRIVLAGVAVHAVLLASLVSYQRGLISEPALLGIDALNGLMPLPFGLLGRGAAVREAQVA